MRPSAIRLLVLAGICAGVACAAPGPEELGRSAQPAGAGIVSLGRLGIDTAHLPALGGTSAGGSGLTGTSHTTPDWDGDGIPNESDDCPTVANPDQRDSDGDHIGDACEGAAGPVDYDRDGVPDARDNCPTVPNPAQVDQNMDGIGDACQQTYVGDYDHDGVADVNDDCPTIPNPDQRDSNGNGIGDACEGGWINGASPTPTATFSPTPTPSGWPTATMTPTAAPSPTTSPTDPWGPVGPGP